MRKVKFSIYDNGTWVPCDGRFHVWGQCYEEFTNGAVQCTMGIVEDTSGLVHLVHPDKIEFLEAVALLTNRNDKANIQGQLELAILNAESTWAGDDLTEEITKTRALLQEVSKRDFIAGWEAARSQQYLT